jgi:protein-S-isoprenylcysteine O-methyltransferase Ste14
VSGSSIRVSKAYREPARLNRDSAIDRTDSDMISVFTRITYVAWFVFLLAWLPGYFQQKKTERVPVPATQIATTALIGVAFFLLLSRRPPGYLDIALTSTPVWLGVVGDGLYVASVVFAMWGRVALGSNWSGAVAAVREGHELVQSGPYRFVRHPIYTGLLFAMLGTAFTIGTAASYIAVLLALAAFLVRIRIEEALMVSQFPETYPAYKQQTAALIPFLW